MSAVERQVRARFGGHAEVAAYELGSPVYLTQVDSITGYKVVQEFGPSSARIIAASLFAAANVAEGRDAVEEPAAA